MKTLGGGRRADGPEITLSLRLRGDCAASLINAALARKAKPADLLADTIESLCRDQLFDAILDDRPEAA